MKGASEAVMIRTVEAIVDEHGVAGAGANDLARLSEASLAQDWNRPEEDAAWSHLQPGR